MSKTKRDLVLQLDAEKRQLEIVITRKLNTIFANLTNDASILYTANGSMPARELANNYKPEFLKEIRDAMRQSIKRFGFNLRGDLEAKGFEFDSINKKQFIDWDIKGTIKITDEGLKEKENRINDEFLREATFFIANESENQNNFVADTNANMLNEATAAALFLFATNQRKKQNEINNLVENLGLADGKERAKIQNQIDLLQREFDSNITNERKIVAKTIKDDLLDKRQARSELIAAQNVGLAESWARQKEGELINDAGLIASNGKQVEVKKEWRAILDSRTRPSHAEADSQQTGINDSFNVGGELLKYPRDPNGSAGNIINCRCVSYQEIVS